MTDLSVTGVTSPRTAGLCRMFTDHPASIGETYSEHRRVALSFARPLAVATLAALVHAFLPFLFKTTASMIVKELAERMASRCRACPAGRLHRPDLFAEETRVSAAVR